MDAYIYQAALFCEQCIAAIKETRKDHCGTCGGFHAVIDSMDCRGFNQETGEPRYENLYDSDDYPKGPYSDGGGEADSPQHCDSCGTFLENPLTPDGAQYVRELVVQDRASGKGDGVAAVLWADFYGLHDDNEGKQS